MLNQRSFSLLPNVSDFFAIQCDYLRINSLPDYVIVKTSEGDNFPMRAGEEVRFDAVTRLEIFNPMLVEQKIEILTGINTRFYSNRMFGEVSVINGEIRRVKNNQCFWGSLNGISSAGNYPTVEFYNPVGSGVNAFINQIIVSSFAVGSSDVGCGFYNNTVSASLGNLANKKAGGSLIPVTYHRLDSAVLPSTFGGYISISGLEVVENGVLVVPLSEPAMLPEGYGLLLFSSVTGSSFRGHVQGFLENANA